jgi:cell division protein FtsL
MLPAKPRQPFLLVFVFALVCVLSSIALVYTKHQSRKLFIELEALTHVRDELRVATDDLSLARPESSDIYVIERP